MIRKTVAILLALCFMFVLVACDEDPVDEYTPANIVFPFTKTWDDNGNEAGDRPGSITVKLFRYQEGGSYDPSGTAFRTITVTGDANAETWTDDEALTFSNNGTSGGNNDLFYRKNGKYYPYLFAIEEAPISGYTKTASKNPLVTMSVTTGTGAYVVKDPVNQSDWPVTIQGSKMSFVITKNGVSASSRFTIWTPVKLSALEQAILKRGIQELQIKESADADVWVPGEANFLSGTASNGYGFYVAIGEDGAYIVITDSTMREMYAVGSFTRSQEDDYECSITNTPGETPPEPITIDVAKVWRDKNNKDGSRPDAVTIRLLANGEATEKSITLSGDDWKGAFEGLDPTDESGNVITYTIKEDAVSGYTTSISGNAEKGFKVTNVKRETPPVIPDVPKTGDKSHASLDLFIMLTAAGAAVWLIRRTRKMRRR